MKIYSCFIIPVLVLFYTIKVNAQETTAQNYIVITRNIAQLKPIIETAALLQQDGEPKFGTFEVVICGKAIAEIVKPEVMKGILTMAAKNKVTLLACGLSMKKFNILEADIPEPIKVVENGLLYNFHAQQKGALSIEL